MRGKKFEIKGYFFFFENGEEIIDLAECQTFE